MSEIESGKLPNKIKELRKPLLCTLCNCRFADVIIMSHHKCIDDHDMHVPTDEINPRDLSILELKKLLSEKGERTSGCKSILITRLENILAYEKL